MTTQVLVLGLDAAAAPVIDRLVAAGRAPTLRALATRGSTFELASPLRTLPGAIWPELCTGISGARSGHYYQPAQLHPGEAAPRWTVETDVDAEEQLWVVAGRAGRQVAAIDVPQTVIAPSLGGMQVIEYGGHDATYPPASEPAGLRDELGARHGWHPLRPPGTERGAPCDVFRSEHDHDALLDALLTGVERKTAIIEDVLARADHDLVVAAFSETHCVGHQFWCWYDEDHPLHAADASPRRRDAIPSVYEAVDAAVGRLVALAGPDAEVLVVATHGMGRAVGGYQLVPEVIERLGLGPRGSTIAQAPSRLPAPVRSVARRTIPARLRDRRNVAAGNLPHLHLEHASTRAVTVTNNRCGAVRLNLAGRDPRGCVEPGEAAGLLELIRAAFLELRDPRSGEPIARRVFTADEEWGPDRHVSVPDLVVDFRPELAPIDAAESARLGRVELPIRRVDEHGPRRTGDHLPDSRVWVAGPRLSGLGPVAGANVLDVTPTVLSLLDVAVPAGLDGRPWTLDAG